MPRGDPHKNRLCVLNKKLFFVSSLITRGISDKGGNFVDWFDKIFAANADPSYSQVESLHHSQSVL